MSKKVFKAYQFLDSIIDNDFKNEEEFNKVVKGIIARLEELNDNSDCLKPYYAQIILYLIEKKQLVLSKKKEVIQIENIELPPPPPPLNLKPLKSLL